MLLDWPPNSPDLNPIENLWSWLASQLRRMKNPPKTGEELQWIRSSRKVLHFSRPNGWHSFTNFTDKPVKLPAGELLQTSAPLANGKLPAYSTAWLFVHPKI